MPRVPSCDGIMTTESVTREKSPSPELPPGETGANWGFQVSLVHQAAPSRKRHRISRAHRREPSLLTSITRDHFKPRAPPHPREALSPMCYSASEEPHNRICPVERALAIHIRSRALKGTSTKLTLAGRFLALSGYMKWWVVRLPTSFSKPTVGAWFILRGKRG